MTHPPSRTTRTAIGLLLAAALIWPALLGVAGRGPWWEVALTTLVVGAAGVLGVSWAEHRGEQRVRSTERAAERDRAWLERQLRRAETRAEHDPLTGLLNRRGLERVTVDLTRRADAVGVLVIDVDDFKEVNDRLGHDAGDEVLRNLADRLCRCVRPTDALARTGGDEFVVVLPDTGPAELDAVARRIHDATRDGGSSLPALPRVSIGVSGARMRGAAVGRDAVAELVRRADRDLYRAKAAKRELPGGAARGADGNFPDEQVC